MVVIILCSTIPLCKLSDIFQICYINNLVSKVFVFQNKPLNVNSFKLISIFMQHDFLL